MREKWGGLLSLLERHPDRFVVERIPKNDRVSLATASNMERATDSGNAGATGISTAGGAESVGNGSVPVTHSTSGDVVDGTAVAPIRIGEDGKEIEEGVEESADMDEDMSNASRCLHVGNVPVGYTEVQLMREFEKFGTLEGLKLISQKNNVRRFAFVTFKTVAQAMTAKHCLSKVYPWKSAISFAHKDISGNGGGHMHGYGHGHGHGQSVAMHTQGHSHLPHGAVAHGTNAGFNGFNKRSNNLHMQKPHALQSHRGMTQMHGHGQPGGPMGYLLSQRTGSPSTGGYHHHHSYLDPTAIMSTSMGSPQHLEHHAFASEEESSGGVAGFMNHSNGQLAQPAAAHGHRAVVAHAIKDPAVLQRLCDDTYVPTQPWPTDSISDPILISAIQHQLLEFNGTTTISKLRGYLKHRIGVSDNIKSVPLKALLLAYPQHFSVEGNIVSMLPTSATL